MSSMGVGYVPRCTAWCSNADYLAKSGKFGKTKRKNGVGLTILEGQVADIPQDAAGNMNNVRTDCQGLETVSTNAWPRSTLLPPRTLPLRPRLGPAQHPPTLQSPPSLTPSCLLPHLPLRLEQLSEELPLLPVAMLLGPHLHP